MEWPSLSEAALFLSLCIHLFALYALYVSRSLQPTSLNSPRHEGALQRSPAAAAATCSEKRTAHLGPSRRAKQGNEECGCCQLTDPRDRKVIDAVAAADEGEMLWQLTDSENDNSECKDAFLEGFPAQRDKIRKCIRCIQEIADCIDKTHMDCTIASLVANATGGTSEFLNILGVALTPHTARGSLALTATGIGLGAAATLTQILASISKQVINSTKKKQAQKLMKECERNLKMAKSPDETDNCSPSDKGEKIKDMEDMVEIIKRVFTVANQVPDVYKSPERIKRHVEVWKYIQADPGLKGTAKQISAAKSKALETIKGIAQVEEKCEGTSLAMTKEARLQSAISAAFNLLEKAKSTYKDAKHLSEGAKAEMALEIRVEAQKLDEELEKLNKVYNKLKKGVAPSNSSREAMIC